MANYVKYSTTTQSKALKAGNFWLGVKNDGKGPTSSTDYYTALAPPSGGFTIYSNKTSNGPAIYQASNESQLVAITNQLGNQSFTTSAQCLTWYVTQTDKFCVNRTYEGIVTDGLVLNLDAGFTPSYPTSGTTWYDVSSSGNTGTLTNGPTFSGANGGSVVFDGVDDYVSVNVDSFIRNNVAYTLNSFFYLNSVTGGASYNIMTTPNSDEGGDGFWQHFNLFSGAWLWRTEDNVSGEYGGTVANPTPFSSNTYYYLTSVIKTNTIIFYINGVYYSTINTSFQWSRLRTDRTANLFLGSGYDSRYPMSGNIYTFSLYNRELTATEVLQNYNAQKGRFGL